MKIDIYAIYNELDGKMYVGQTKRGYKLRFKEHMRHEGGCPLFHKAIKKCGENNFHTELLDVANSQAEADALEKAWIYLLGTYKKDNGYNLSMGGAIGSFNDDTIEKMRKRTGKNNGFFGKHHAKEQREKWSAERKGLYSGSNHPRARKVICVETGEIFDCIKYAEIKTGARRQRISQVCEGVTGRKTAGGYHWKYVEDGSN